MKTQSQNIKVKDYLTKERWVKGSKALYDECDCLMTAVNSCYPSYTYSQRVTRLIVNELQLGNDMEVTAWNDSPERTFEDVHNLCLKLDI